MQKRINWIVGILSLLVSVGAIYIGIMLINDPSGEINSLNSVIVEKSPFENFFIPGALLFSFLGIGNLFAGIFSFLRFPLTGFMVVVLGIGLVFWTTIHLFLFGLIVYFEPVYIAIGITQFFLGMKQYKLNLPARD